MRKPWPSSGTMLFFCIQCTCKKYLTCKKDLTFISKCSLSLFSSSGLLDFIVSWLLEFMQCHLSAWDNQQNVLYLTTKKQKGDGCRFFSWTSYFIYVRYNLWHHWQLLWRPSEMDTHTTNTHSGEASADYGPCKIQSSSAALYILGLRLPDSAIMNCSAFISGGRWQIRR